MPTVGSQGEAFPDARCTPVQEEAAVPPPAPEEGEGGEEGEFAMPEMDAPRRLTLVAPLILSEIIYLLIRFRKSTSSQNRPLNVLISNNNQ